MLEPLMRTDRKVILIMTSAALLLLLFRRFGGSNFFEQELAVGPFAGHPRRSVLGDFYWFAACFVMLGLVPFLIAGGAKNPAAAGAGFGDWRFGLRGTLWMYGLMVPLVESGVENLIRLFGGA